MWTYSQESEVLFATVAWSRHATRVKARRVTKPNKGCERDYRKRDTKSSSFLLKIVQTSVTTDHRILVSEFISFKLEGSFFLSIEGVFGNFNFFYKNEKNQLFKLRHFNLSKKFQKIPCVACLCLYKDSEMFARD